MTQKGRAIATDNGVEPADSDNHGYGDRRYHLVRDVQAVGLLCRAGDEREAEREQRSAREDNQRRRKRLRTICIRAVLIETISASWAAKPEAKVSF